MRLRRRTDPNQGGYPQYQQPPQGQQQWSQQTPQNQQQGQQQWSQQQQYQGQQQPQNQGYQQPQQYQGPQQPPGQEYQQPPQQYQGQQPQQYQGPQQQPQQYQQGPPQQQPGPVYRPPKKRPSKMLVIAVIAVVAILLVASMAFLFWPEESDGDGGENVAHEVVPKVIGTGAYEDAATGTVGSSGGTIAVNSGPMRGLSIVIPQGAVETSVAFDINSAVVSSAEGLPETGSIASRMIDIGTDGTPEWDEFKMFETSLTVTLPYDASLVTEEEGVRFYQYD
ncbi:MAG: hypothetical protein WC375_07640, partial [Methanomassiliicoccales archaeon]